MTNYWLMKSEPHVYSYDDLVKDGSTHWDGVRNYQARNFMRDKMRIGDMVLYYHSNTKPPHVAGVSQICKESYPDITQFDEKSRAYKGIIKTVNSQPVLICSISTNRPPRYRNSMTHSQPSSSTSVAVGSELSVS